MGSPQPLPTNPWQPRQLFDRATELIWGLYDDVSVTEMGRKIDKQD